MMAMMNPMMMNGLNQSPYGMNPMTSNPMLPLLMMSMMSGGMNQSQQGATQGAPANNMMNNPMMAMMMMSMMMGGGMGGMGSMGGMGGMNPLWLMMMMNPNSMPNPALMMTAFGSGINNNPLQQPMMQLPYLSNAFSQFMPQLMGNQPYNNQASKEQPKPKVEEKKAEETAPVNLKLKERKGKVWPFFPS